jgi:hypothetical protein
MGPEDQRVPAGKVTEAMPKLKTSSAVLNDFKFT